MGPHLSSRQLQRKEKRNKKRNEKRNEKRNKKRNEKRNNRFFKIAKTWYSCGSRQVNIFEFPNFRGTKLIWVYEGRLSRASSWISGKFWKSGKSPEGRLALPR